MSDAFSVKPPALAGSRVSTGGEAAPSDPYDFSIVLGGPLYQIVRRAHMSGDALERLRRRLVVISLFAWLPLLRSTTSTGGVSWAPVRAGRDAYARQSHRDGRTSTA